MEPQNTLAPSPFLPGTVIQYAWDSTTLGWAKTCWRLYYYQMIRGLRPKATGHHLVFGGAYASALEIYHKSRAAGETHDNALRQAVITALQKTVSYEPPTGETKKTKANLLRTVIWYLDRFEHDPAVTITLPNGKAAVELSFRFELDAMASEDQPYVLSGHLDRFVSFQGSLYDMDQKTTGGTLSSYYFDQFNPHNQMSLYTLAGQVCFQTPIKGVIIDAAQIAVGFSEFSRGMTHRTQGQLDEWLDSALFIMKTQRELATNAVDIINGEPQPECGEVAWPMNDTACNNYGGCTFRGICSKDPSVRENFIQSGFEVRRWNPLEPR